MIISETTNTENELKPAIHSLLPYILDYFTRGALLVRLRFRGANYYSDVSVTGQYGDTWTQNAEFCKKLNLFIK